MGTTELGVVDQFMKHVDICFKSLQGATNLLQQQWDYLLKLVENLKFLSGLSIRIEGAQLAEMRLLVPGGSARNIYNIYRRLDCHQPGCHRPGSCNRKFGTLSY